MEILNNVSDGAGFKLLQATNMVSCLLGNSAAWGLAERVGDTTDCVMWVYYSCWPLQLCTQSFLAFYTLPAKDIYAETDFQS